MNSAKANSESGSDGAVGFVVATDLAVATGVGLAGGAGVGLGGDGSAGDVVVSSLDSLFASTDCSTGLEIVGFVSCAVGAETVSAFFGSIESPAAEFATETAGAAGVVSAFVVSDGVEAERGAGEVAVTGAAIAAEPVADFGRAVGVLISPLVEAIAAEGAVTVLVGLEAGGVASGFPGGAGLNESRIFSAAMHNCDRICGICSKTVSAGNRSFINRGR